MKKNTPDKRDIVLKLVFEAGKDNRRKKIIS